MSEAMSIREIEAQYPAEWVLLEDVVTNELMEITRGRVLWHCKDREEIDRKAREFGARRSAVLFAGKLPKDTLTGI